MITLDTTIKTVLSDPTFLSPTNLPSHVAQAARTLVDSNVKTRACDAKPVSTLVGKAYILLTPQMPNSQEAVLADMTRRCTPLVDVFAHEMLHITARAMRPEPLPGQAAPRSW